jgi:hypothetical protein
MILKTQAFEAKTKLPIQGLSCGVGGRRLVRPNLGSKLGGKMHVLITNTD